MTTTRKVIVHRVDDPTDYVLVGRVVRYAETEMPYNDAIIAYGDGPNEKSFYVKRIKSGLSIWKIAR